MGIISIQSYTAGMYKKSSLTMLEILADHCSGALERTFAEEKLRQKEFITGKLSELGKNIAASNSPREAAGMILDTADQLFGWDAAYVNFYDRDKDEVFDVVSFDIVDGARKEVAPAFTGGNVHHHARYIIDNGAHLILRDEGGDSSKNDDFVCFGDSDRKSRSLMFVPIRKGNVTMGVISIQSYEPGFYNRDDLNMLQLLADHCSGALDRTLAEEELKKFKKAIEQTANSVIISDKNLNIQYVNTEFENLTGYNLEEIIGKTPAILESGKHDAEFYEKLIGTISSGKVYNGVIINKKKNGYLYYDEITITPLKDIEGKITHFVQTGKDITDRIEAEEELRKAHEDLEKRVEERTRELSESNRLLKREIADRKFAEENLEKSLSLVQATLESTTDGILVVNLESEIVDYNQRFMSLWDLPGDVMNKGLYEPIEEIILAKITSPRTFAEKVRELRNSPDEESFDELRLKDGSIYERYSKPQKIGERCVGRVWTFRDVTQRREAEQALARSEAIYREAIENASGVPYRLIFSYDDFDFVGEGIETLMGYAPEEFSFDILVQHIQDVNLLESDHYESQEQYIQAFRKGEIDQYRVDLRVTTRAGKEKWLSDSSVPIRNGDTGEIIGSLGILQDITWRKQMEEQARIQREQLIHADKMVALGTLVSGVAHEINNPNNFIMLNTPVLLETWKSIKPVLEKHYEENGDFIMGGLKYSEMREHVPRLFSGINEGAKRIRNIVRELRDFVRSHPREEREHVDVNAVVKSALTLVSNMIRKSTENFSVNYGIGLPKVEGNFQRLEQVVINLLQNACQALKDRQSAISVRTSWSRNENHVIIMVEDEGGGIEEEKIKHIMNPFYTTKRDAGGTGLGLSISSNIVNEHNGNLEFISRPGKGTKALVVLPLNGGKRDSGATKTFRRIKEKNNLKHEQI